MRVRSAVKKIFLLLICVLLLAHGCAAQEQRVAGWSSFGDSVEFGGKKYSRLLAIGDIHGQFSRFMSMYEKVGVNDDDLVIFLGDYIEGYKAGEDLKTVLWLMEQSRKENFVLLSGNWERKFLQDCIDEQGNLKNAPKWHLVQELKTANDPGLIRKIRDFFSNLKFDQELQAGGRTFVFSHAGIKDGVPLTQQSEYDLMFDKRFCRKYAGESFVVIGHRPVQAEFGKNTTVPVKVEGRNILMVDTNCRREKGFSSCVNVLTGEFWQSDTDRQ